MPNVSESPRFSVVVKKAQEFDPSSAQEGRRMDRQGEGEG